MVLLDLKQQDCGTAVPGSARAGSRLWRREEEKSTGSCGMIATRERSSCRGSLQMSTPSISTRLPALGSTRRRRLYFHGVRDVRSINCGYLGKKNLSKKKDKKTATEEEKVGAERGCRLADQKERRFSTAGASYDADLFLRLE